jgi:hypothetical protein
MANYFIMQVTQPKYKIFYVFYTNRGGNSLNVSINRAPLRLPLKNTLTDSTVIVFYMLPVVEQGYNGGEV